MTIAENIAKTINNTVKEQMKEIINRLTEMGFTGVNIAYSDTNIDTGKRKYSCLRIEAELNLNFLEHRE